MILVAHQPAHSPQRKENCRFNPHDPNKTPLAAPQCSYLLCAGYASGAFLPLIINLQICVVMSLYHDPLSCAPADLTASPVFNVNESVSVCGSFLPGLTSTLRITSSDIIINSIKLTSCAVEYKSTPTNHACQHDIITAFS